MESKKVMCVLSHIHTDFAHSHTATQQHSMNVSSSLSVSLFSPDKRRGEKNVTDKEVFILVHRNDVRLPPHVLVRQRPCKALR